MPRLARFKEELALGLTPSLHELDAPFWVDGRNVVFRGGKVQKMKGWVEPLNPSDLDPPRGMYQYRDTDGMQYLFWGDQTNIWRWNTSAITVSGAGYTGYTNETSLHDASVWSFTNWGRWILATNNKDTPQILKFTDVTPLFAAMGGLTFSTAKIFLSRGPHILAFNTSNGPNWIEWADADDPELWSPASNNSAGNIVVHDLESEIKAAVPLGDRIAVYGTDSMALVSYLGSPFYFGVQPAINGIGAISQQAVVSVGRRNFGLGQQGFWVADGAQFNYIDDPAIREYVKERINLNQKSKVCAYHDEYANQVIWYYPEGANTEPSEGVGFDYIRNVWSIYDHGRTSAIERQVFSYPLALTSGGRVLAHATGDDANTSPITAYATSKPLDLGEPGLFKFIDHLRFAVAGSGLQVRLGTQVRLDDAITWGNYNAVDTGHDPFYWTTGTRYLRIQLYSDQLGDAWALAGIDVNGALLGETA